MRQSEGTKVLDSFGNFRPEGIGGFEGSHQFPVHQYKQKSTPSFLNPFLRKVWENIRLVGHLDSRWQGD